MDRWNYGTYDPILEQKPIPVFRLLSPLRAPVPGTALVLVPREGHPITVRHGEPVPDPRYGVHQYSCLVDLAEHRLAFELPLVSRDPGFVFRARVMVGCRVGEPAVIVARGIRDVGATLYEPVKQMLRPVARRFDIAEFHEAEESLNRALGPFAGDSALRLRGPSVELLLDDDEVRKAAREFRDVRRETRLNAMRRDRHLEMMRREGAEGLLAEIVEAEGARAALEWIARAEADERVELTRTLDKLLARGGVDREPFDHVDVERDVVNRIIGGSDVAFGGTRSSRVRGVLPPDPPPVLPPDDPPGPPQDSYPAGPTQPPGRPPADEPPGEHSEHSEHSHGVTGSRGSRIRGMRRPDDGG
ncbi:hypothetical protein AGRA3207_003191 [Actinomadura graeca]|uniref:Band 7 domain-containing protein n=1 Tax=Actinomadura graeca TaxID=2750812 RepID=A0ABX8QW70_9ACTN|nr:hypothetical protein [Actinomadura graeca]QXJ22224.1 hypothetical protein AGRA3207_003191 [Actinomadura graeca]